MDKYITILPNSSSPAAKRKASDFPNSEPPKKQINTQHKDGLPTQNRFESLQNDKSQGPISHPTKTNKPKIPPIVTTGLDMSGIHELMTKVNIEKNKYLVKFMTIGTKIMLQTIEDFRKTVDALKSQNSKFFTHDINVEKTTKFVLSGLHETPIIEIKTNLQENDVICLDIKKMNTKNPDHCLYLVYFSQATITLNKLREIKSIQSVIVKWTPYRTSKNGPTQCNNCQLYGHGNRHCNLAPRCLLCGEGHNKANCPKIGTDNFIPRCCLCLENHLANDLQCPKRAEYVKMRITTTSRLNSHKPPAIFQANSKGTSSQTTLIYPPSSSSAAYLTSSILNQPTTPQFQSNTTSIEQKKYPPRPSYASMLTQRVEPTNKDLFTAEELIELTTTLITDLLRCRTKADQIQAVSNLAIKFVYSKNNGP